MASNLYEVLDVPRDATVEQIRKAYKQKALKTHPDKLPSSMSEEERKASGDKFREIGHACEILTDLEKRKEYDIHGVWPPPQLENNAPDSFFHDNMPGRQRGQRSYTFPNQFFTHHHHHHSYSNFAFRDPLEFFNSIFKEFDNIFAQGPSPLSSFSMSPFGNMRSQSLFSDSSFPPMPSMYPMPTIAFAPFPSMFENSQGRGNFSSESICTTSVNGVTETTHTKRDANGDEHITRKYPDGREVYTINGVEQPARGHLPSNQPQPRAIRHHSSPRPQSRPHHRRTMPSYSQTHQTQSRHNTLVQPQRTLFNAQVTQGPVYDAPLPLYPGGSTDYTYTQTPAERPVYREQEWRVHDRYASEDTDRYNDRHRSSYRD